MSRVVDLLVALQAKNIAVSVEGDQLLVTAPPGAITPDIREQVRAMKPEILRLLARAPVEALPPPPGERPSGRTRTLSRPQRAIWLLEQVNPGTSVWNVPLVFDVRGALHPGVLEASVRALLERHEALRSRFLAVGGEPEVEAVPLGDWRIEQSDLRGDPDADAAAGTLAKADADRPFDLGSGLLCRARLMRTGPESHVLALVFHHIAVDGWSLGLIVDQLSRLYDATLRGAANPLSPPRAGYQAFVEDEQGKEAETQTDLEWWCRTLSGDLPVTSLAADRSRPHRGKARRLSVEIDADMTARLEAFAKQHAATPFMVLFAVFNLLNHRYTGDTDLLIATPVSGRDRPEFADVVGMFVNTLAVRTGIDSELTFAELLGRVRGSVLEAFARQNVAFDRVVEAVRPPRQHGQTPLTPLSFAYQSMRIPELRLGPAGVTPRPIDFAGSRYDLSVEVWKAGAGLSCQFEYATELFDADAVVRMMGHFRSLLAAALCDPERRVSELPLLTEAEQRHLVAGLNDTRADYAADRRIEALFAGQAAAAPDAPAIVHDGRAVSYRALDEQANQVAHRLLAADAGPGTIVGVCLERSPDLVAAILGILKAGAAYLPLDPRYPAQRLLFMLEDSAAPVLVTRSALDAVSNFSGVVIDLDAEREAIAREAVTPPDIRASADDLAYVIYTSGSTGVPKGTLLRHSATFLIDWARRAFSQDDLSRSVASTSIGFDFSVFEIFVPLCTGGAVLLANDPLDLPHPDSRPTAISVVPSVLAELVRRRAIPDSVRVIVAGGEVLTDRLVQSAYETSKVERIYNGYGPTECTTFATMALAPRGAGREPPIGRPLANVQVYVLDAQRQLVPFGVAGELYIAGDGLARGYLNRPELTAERFVANPYGPPGSRMYRTGDLVRWLPDGQLAFIGRIDQQLKLRGQRVELGEIEASLQRHPAVRDAVVVARMDGEGETSLVGYVVPRGAAPQLAELRDHLKSWLPQHMIPAAFVVLDAFPLNRSGKTDRAALPPPPGQAAGSDEPAYMPPIEEAVADVFKQAIGCAHVGADDNFFDLGGHSLLTMRVAAELERLLAQPISPAWIFQAPTAAQLAKLLDAKLVAAASHITPLQPLGDRPPLFCMHDLVSRPLSYVSLARLMAPDQPLYGLGPGPLEARFVAHPSLELLTQAYVQAIKAIQPCGPYRIVGYSFGGVPAFDLACALEAGGDTVQLILIDSFVKRRLPGVLHIAKWLARYRRTALREVYWARDRIFKRRGTIRDTEIPDWVPQSSRGLARALLQVQETNRYKPFRGSTVFLESASREPVQELFNLDGMNGWRDLLGGPLLRLKLQAEHFWMMRDPLVSEIASILRSC